MSAPHPAPVPVSDLALAATALPSTGLSSTALSPTRRSTVQRGRNRAVEDREVLHEILGAALMCHLGVDVGDHPVVVPTAFGYDLDGPDEGGSLYVHGSVASQSLTRSPGMTICVTITLLDGLVTARSAFHHSMNYRSAMVIGRGRLVTEDAEKRRALARVVDQMVPGRSATLRPHSRKELAATSVVAVPLLEASVKVRTGGPIDEPDDVAAGIWGGHIPIRLAAGCVVPDQDTGTEATVPLDVRRRAEQLRA